MLRGLGFKRSTINNMSTNKHKLGQLVIASARLSSLSHHLQDTSGPNTIQIPNYSNYRDSRKGAMRLEAWSLKLKAATWHDLGCDMKRGQDQGETIISILDDLRDPLVLAENTRERGTSGLFSALVFRFAARIARLRIVKFVGEGICLRSTSAGDEDQTRISYSLRSLSLNFKLYSKLQVTPSRSVMEKQRRDQLKGESNYKMRRDRQPARHV
jgi:hypothetical protein